LLGAAHTRRGRPDGTSGTVGGRHHLDADFSALSATGRASSTSALARARGPPREWPRRQG